MRVIIAVIFPLTKNYFSLYHAIFLVTLDQACPPLQQLERILPNQLRTGCTGHALGCWVDVYDAVLCIQNNHPAAHAIYDGFARHRHQVQQF